MARLKIFTYPDTVLKKKALPVEKVTDHLKELANNMLETMYEAPGVGLAANQVGELVRLIVIDTRPTDDDGNVEEEKMTELERVVNFPVVLFNPEIKEKKGDTSYEEGCLSVPGYVEWVDRADYVEVHGLDKEGREITIKTDGLLSVCLQHEMDHLEGKLFIDRLSVIKRNIIKSKIKKNGYSKAKDKTAAL